MALEGSLGEFGLVDIFQLIAMQKKSGILTVSCKNKETVSVVFLDGDFIRAFAGDLNTQFSNAMVSAEKVTIEQLRVALRATSTATSISETFVKLDYMTPEEARGWNLVLTEDIIFDLLLWKEGIYKFTQETIYKGEYEDLVGVEHILMEGARQADEWPLLLKKISSSKTIYEKIQTEEFVEGNSEQDAFLQDNDSSVLQYVNGERTVNEIISRSGRGSFSVYHELAGAISNQKIKICNPKGKIKKKRFNEISLDSIKEFLHAPMVINGLLSVFAIFFVFIFLRLILLRDKPLFQEIHETSHKFRTLSTDNTKDSITFSLNLYHLRHNKYPDTLEALKKGGFLDKEINLEGWEYHQHGSTIQLTFYK